jgi:DNA topoisomerase-1
MAKHLVIVESPAKAKTINKFLGPEYTVKASMGHVKDLPKSKLGVDIAKDFEPHYITIRTRSKLLKEIKAAAKGAKHIYLATDPDREGEAIGWHLGLELKNAKNEVHRILFHEITSKAIQEAVRTPRDIDMNLVNAQQARRVLDRLVGYSLSPLLWKKVRRGLSAGRVQSVTVKILVDREREIGLFVPHEFWKLEVELQAAKGRFKAHLYSVAGQKLEEVGAELAQGLALELPALSWRVSGLNRKEQKRNPTPPFITSKLQQEASRKLHYSAKKTMLVAQQLYEGLELGEEGAVGLITYMRTDSVRVAEEAQAEAARFIAERYGAESLPAKPPAYRNKSQSQDAHEAIRPTSVLREPKDLAKWLSLDQQRLYKLIWQRFVASQMRPALLDVTSVDVAAEDQPGRERAGFRASGSIMKFPGFTAVYTEGQDEDEAAKEGAEDEERLPELTEQEPLRYLAGQPSQHFTQPPPRYTEATLVKALEEKNIGRPSTYAPTISTVLDRRYAERMEGGRLKPSELGTTITELLATHFKEVLNVEFTASMEEQLDKVEEGSLAWTEAVRGFWTVFEKDLEKASADMPNLKKELEVATDVVCEKCGAHMVVKWGRHGKFLACPTYPACKNTKPLEERADGVLAPKVEEALDEKCDKCGSAMIYKQGRFGRFIACSNYPACKNTRPIKQDIGIDCPKGCGGQVIVRRSKRGRAFYGCSSYPKCDFVSWDKPVPEACPQCGSKYLLEKSGRRGPTVRNCPTDGCGYRREMGSPLTGSGQGPEEPAPAALVKEGE